MDATKTLPRLAQRDLRNRSSEILRRTNAGESFIITTRGEQVALLSPFNDTPTKEEQTTRARQPARPATRHGGWAKLPLFKVNTPLQGDLDELRADR